MCKNRYKNQYHITKSCLSGHYVPDWYASGEKIEIPNEIRDEAKKIVNDNCLLDNNHIFENQETFNFYFNKYCEKKENEIEFDWQDLNRFLPGRSQNIFFGNWIEIILGKILSMRTGYENVSKYVDNGITYKQDGVDKKLECDVLCKNDEKKHILFIESKSSNKQDEAKKDGEIKKFLNKKRILEETYRDFNIEAIYYFNKVKHGKEGEEYVKEYGYRIVKTPEVLANRLKFSENEFMLFKSCILYILETITEYNINKI